jgi:ferredoxin-NADP reductase
MSNGKNAKNVIMTHKDIQRYTAVPLHTLNRRMVNKSLTQCGPAELMAQTQHENMVNDSRPTVENFPSAKTTKTRRISSDGFVF